MWGLVPPINGGLSVAHTFGPSVRYPRVERLTGRRNNDVLGRMVMSDFARYA